jgi:hypothetical protein
MSFGALLGRFLPPQQRRFPKVFEAGVLALYASYYHYLLEPCLLDAGFLFTCSRVATLLFLVISFS